MATTATMTPEAIRTLRVALGLNQAELATAVGCSPTSVHKWETGKSAPLPLYARELARLARQAERQAAKTPTP